MGWNPARIDVYKDSDVLNKSPHFSYLQEVFQNSYPRPNLPYYTLISEVMQRYINGVLSGNKTKKDALGSAQEEAQRIVEQYSKKWFN